MFIISGSQKNSISKGILKVLALIVSLLYLLAKSIGSIVFSPVLLLISIPWRGYRPSRFVWIGYIAWLLFLAVLPWQLGKMLDAERDRVIIVMESYTQLRGSIGDIPYADLITFYALKNDLDPALVAAVIEKESNFDPDAVSPMGARGLMQIMPTTFFEIEEPGDCTLDIVNRADCLFDPEVNIRVGTRHLRQLLDFYGGDTVLTLAAYNAGVNAVAKYEDNHESRGIPPFKETQDYVDGILQLWRDYRHGEEIPEVSKDLISDLENYQELAVKANAIFLFVLALKLITMPHQNFRRII